MDNVSSGEDRGVFISHMSFSSNEATMSSVQCLRKFVNERLTAAAEEIFGVFQKTIVEYEEQIRLLDLVWKPEIKLHRLELLQHHVGEEEEDLADQQLCTKDWNSSVDLEEPEPTQVKEEQEEHCTGQEEEELVPKQETDNFILILTDVEIDKSETESNNNHLSHESPVIESQDQLPQQHVCKEEEVLTDQQLCNQNQNSSLNYEDPNLPNLPKTKGEQEEHCSSQEEEHLAVKQETDAFMLTPAHEKSDHSEPRPLSDLRLLSDNSQDQEKLKHVDSCSTRNTELKSKERHGKNRSQSKNVLSSTMSKIDCNTDTGKKSFTCDTCGKAFKYRSELNIHLRIHTGEKPYSCDKCGKHFRYRCNMLAHMRIHTGEKPYSCNTCGKGFRYRNDFLDHMRIHAGENPYLCKTCGKSLRSRTAFLIHKRAHTGENSYLCKICGKTLKTRPGLMVHIRTHTGETPYLCNICGRRFNASSILSTHMRTHTGEKPYSCETCGKRFTLSGELKVHKRTHTGEKPYSCETCGKSFVRNNVLKLHIKIHTGEKPYSCETCGKSFVRNCALKVHIRTHTGEKPYSCSTCGKRFRGKSASLKHMERHTGEKSYETG